jgi:hypothetical protein
MARAKRIFLTGHVWHSPVKRNQKWFNGVNSSPMLYGKVRGKIGEILRDLYRQKGLQMVL